MIYSHNHCCSIWCLHTLTIIKLWPTCYFEKNDDGAGCCLAFYRALLEFHCCIGTHNIWLSFFFFLMCISSSSVRKICELSLSSFEMIGHIAHVFYPATRFTCYVYAFWMIYDIIDMQHLKKKNLYTLHRSRTPKKSNNFTAYLLWLSANLSQKQPEWCARVEMEILYEGALNGWLHVVWNMWTILCQQNIIDFIPFFFLLYSMVLYASWRRYIQEQQIIRNMKYGEVEENLEFHWFNPVQRQLLLKRWLHHMNL